MKNTPQDPDTSEVSSASPKRFPRQVLKPDDRGVLWHVPDDFEPEYAEMVYSNIGAHLNNERFNLDEQGSIFIKYKGNDIFSFSISLPHKVHGAHIIGTFQALSLPGKFKKDGIINSSEILHDRYISGTEAFLTYDRKIAKSQEKKDALYFFEQYGLENDGNLLNKFDEEHFLIPQVMRQQTEQLKERLLKKYADTLAEKGLSVAKI